MKIEMQQSTGVENIDIDFNQDASYCYPYDKFRRQVSLRISYSSITSLGALQGMPLVSINVIDLIVKEELELYTRIYYLSSFRFQFLHPSIF